MSENPKAGPQPDTQINELNNGPVHLPDQPGAPFIPQAEFGMVELTHEPSALEELAQAVLDGRVSFEQKTSRAGVVRTRVKVMTAEEARRAVIRGEFD